MQQQCNNIATTMQQHCYNNATTLQQQYNNIATTMQQHCTVCRAAAQPHGEQRCDDVRCPHPLHGQAGALHLREVRVRPPVLQGIEAQEFNNKRGGGLIY